MTQIEVYTGNEITPHSASDAITVLLDKWLATKMNRSGSTKTARAYRDAMLSFRAGLRAEGHDMDSDLRVIAGFANEWAGRPASGVHNGREVTASTFNQRLACVSSFYSWAIKQGWTDKNPISRVDRRPVQSYAHAVALDAAEVKRRLKAIDRADLAGMRDYALLVVALQTGRRVTELANLRWRNLQILDNRVYMRFERAKGGKVMQDKLDVTTSKALITYLHAVYGAQLGSMAADAPIWISLSRRNYGQAMSVQTIGDVCEKRLGTSKVHTLRHTFAHAMEKAGAKVSDIQARLGHESLQTTGRYLAALDSAENAHADDLARMFGIGD